MANRGFDEVTSFARTLPFASPDAREARCSPGASNQALHEMLGARPVRFKEVKVAARSWSCAIRTEACPWRGGFQLRGQPDAPERVRAKTQASQTPLENRRVRRVA